MISNHLKPHTVKVGEGRDDDEYVVSRFDHVIPPINVVSIYGDDAHNRG